MSKKSSRRGNGPTPETIHDRDATFHLGPDLGFNDPFFRQPNPFTFSVSSPGQNSQQQGAVGGDAPPNVGHGTGPMGSTFCRTDLRFNAPNLRSATNFITAQNVMIGNNNSMDIHYNRTRFQESDSEESSPDEEGPLDPREEYEKKKKEEERYEKSAQLQETLRSSRPISTEEIRAVSKCLIGAWRKFLRYLDVEDELLDQYYQEYMPNGLAEVVYQALDYWKRNTDSPEVQKVANALGRVNMWDTVQDHLRP